MPIERLLVFYWTQLFWLANKFQFYSILLQSNTIRINSLFHYCTSTILYFFFISLIEFSCNWSKCNASICKYTNYFHLKKETVNNIGSDDLHYARVQCALFDICSKNIPYYCAPLFSDFGRCGLCSVVVFFHSYKYEWKRSKINARSVRKTRKNVN